MFWDEQWVFDGWYVNLEAVNRRDGRHLLTSDRVLDVWVPQDGAAALKDEDELEAAVAEGAFTADEAEAFRGACPGRAGHLRGRRVPVRRAVAGLATRSRLGATRAAGGGDLGLRRARRSRRP